MHSRLLNDTHGIRTFVLVFDTGDEVLTELQACAREHRMTSASFTGIGAFRAVTLGYFDIEGRDYLPIPLDEQVEVLSLSGNVALADPDGEPKVHAHVVVGRRDGAAHGGHLLEAHVRPTLELVVTDTEPHLRRSVDAATGLPLIDLNR